MDLNEQVVHSVMEYLDFSEPLSWPPLDHLDAMLFKCNINIDCSALTGAKSITMTWEHFDLRLTYDQGQSCLLKANRTIYKETLPLWIRQVHVCFWEGSVESLRM